MRPAGIRTWEDILDEYRADGGRHVILVGQSHGCAKFAGMTRDHWRWGNDLSVELFVSWDGADLGGGVSSVGDVPKTVLAFYQRDDLAHWQNGQHIEQATEEHELTKLFSHNAIARSAFVHDKTATFIRDTISSVRGRARGGDIATYRIDADGSLGERIELRRLSADLSLAFASRLGETSYLHLLAQRERPGDHAADRRPRHARRGGQRNHPLAGSHSCNIFHDWRWRIGAARQRRRQQHGYQASRHGWIDRVAVLSRDGRRASIKPLERDMGPGLRFSRRQSRVRGTCRCERKSPHRSPAGQRTARGSGGESRRRLWP